jgi:predicted nucleic acid-binding protein
MNAVFLDTLGLLALWDRADQWHATTDDDWRRAWGNYERQSLGEAGIVDHVSLAVMRRLGLTTVFTNDRHFQAAGFTTLF